MRLPIPNWLVKEATRVQSDITAAFADMRKRLEAQKQMREALRINPAFRAAFNALNAAVPEVT